MRELSHARIKTSNAKQPEMGWCDDMYMLIAHIRVYFGDMKWIYIVENKPNTHLNEFQWKNSTQLNKSQFPFHKKKTHTNTEGFIYCLIKMASYSIKSN